LKKSKELINLPVLAIKEGDFISRVHSLIINPSEGRIDYLLLEGEHWYLEKNVLDFNQISAIGNNAVTTEKSANVEPVSKSDGAVELLQKEVFVLNSRVMTRDGRFIGTVTEFIFDENTGKINGCELTPNGGEPAGVIPADKIITFGKKYLIVTEDVESLIAEEASDAEASATPEPAPVIEEAVEDNPALDDVSAEEEDPLAVFSAKQRQYLIGKKVSKTIIDANGNIVVSEGSVITEDIIERALRVDKYVELTMFVE